MRRIGPQWTRQRPQVAVRFDRAVQYCLEECQAGPFGRSLMRRFRVSFLAVAALGAAQVPAVNSHIEQLADREFDLWVQLWVDDRARAGLPTGAPDVSEAGIKKMASDASAILT